VCGESWLQWGRDQLIAEFHEVYDHSDKSKIASMGPRSADRGIFIQQKHTKETHVSFNGAAIS